MRRSSLTGLGTAALAATTAGLLALGCAGASSEAPSPGTDGSFSSDAGVDGPGTAPFQDGGTAPQGIPNDETGLERTDMSGARADAAETPLCNNALTASGALELDCSEASCVNLAACCVGRGDCCGDASNLAPPSLPDFVDCGADVLGCLGEASGLVFGSPTPSITADGTFAPGGDGDFDSGLVLDPVVDLRSTRLELTAHFVVPTDCGAGCLQGAAVSVSTQDDFDATTHVDMLAGLVMSGSRQEVSLVVAGRDVERWPASDGTTWTLRLTPDGRVEVLADTTAKLSSPVGFVPAGAARVVLSGHDLNPTPGDVVAGLSGLDIRASRCDIPSAWGAHGDLVLRERGTPSSLSTPISALSTARGESGATMAALVIDGALYIAKRPGVDASELTLLSSLDNPSLRPLADTAFGSPALLTTASGTRLLLPVESGGDTSLFWGSVDATTGVVTLGDPLLLPSDSVRAYDEPTVAVVDASRVVLIVRRSWRSGEIDFGIYSASESGMDPVELGGLHLNDALRASSAPGFDADEIGGLALVGQDHAWQLYYARRSGARWSIGLLVSDDLIFWRHADEGESVLLPDGSSRESVGVREPAVLFMDQRVTLSYLGLDGSVSWPRFATRRATENAIWRR